MYSGGEDGAAFDKVPGGLHGAGRATDTEFDAHQGQVHRPELPGKEPLPGSWHQYAFCLQQARQ